MSAEDRICNNAILLASIPHVVSSIFKNLPAKQLNTCAKVSVMWREIARKEKRRRMQICCLCEADYHKKVSHSPLYCSCECEETYLKPLLESVLNLPVEPALALILCTESTLRRPKAFESEGSETYIEKLGPARLYSDLITRRNYVAEKILPFFPRTCLVGLCSAFGMLGLTTGMQTTSQMNVCPSLAAVFFPRASGVEIYHFKIHNLDVEIDSPKRFTEVTGIPHGVPIKSLLFFPNSHETIRRSQPFNRAVQHCLRAQHGEVAIGGTFTSHMRFPKHKEEKDCKSFGLAFTGYNLRAASLVIETKTQNAEEIAKKLKMFGWSDLPSGQCVAFMFASYFGDVDIDRNYVEIGIFRTMYPSVPLFTIFERDLIGISYIPGVLGSKYMMYSWHHDITVFVLLSINP